MRQLFISYARENKPDVDELVRDLDALGYQTWVDSSLRGGQTWWEEILRRIADCDVFLVIVSRHTLNSVACKRELQWALALNKPVLPVAVELRPDALPRSLSMRQIVDYSKPGKQAAFALAGGLATLPPAPPPPEQLPEPPPAPLSYLSDLIDQVSAPDPLTHEQQHQIINQLQPALRSADPEEQRGGRYVLETFSKRNDLYADVDRTLAQLGLAEHDTQPPTPPQVTPEGHDQHAPTAPEATAKGRGNLLADPQWADALNAFFAERWVEAVQRFEALQARYPGEGRVETRLEEARRQRDIDAWSAKAEAAAAEGNWDAAVTALENLTGLDPASPDAGARLEQARIAQRRRALVDEMTALHQAGRWDAVVAAARQLARLDPEHPDPGGIVSDAQAKIRDADLADRYAQGLNHLDQEHWQQAVEVFTAIEREQPGFRDAAALLTTAQRQRDLAAWSDQAEAAARHDDWDTAVTVLQSLCAVDPTYRDASARLEQARVAQRRRSLVDKMTALHQAGRWKDVVTAAEELAQLDLDHPDPGGIVSDAKAKIRDALLADVATLLTKAQRQRELATLSDQAAAATEHDDWDTAVTALENLTGLDPAYPDASARLEQARTAQRRKALVDEMTALHQAGRWDALVAAAQQLARLDPDNPDPGGIVSDAQAKIREADLADRYARALNELDQHQWQQAADLFAAIEQEQPGYRDAAALLKTAQQNLTSTAKPHVHREQKLRARVTAIVRVGFDPRSVAVDPGTHTVYVTNRSDGTVSVIDGSTNKVNATVPVGKKPHAFQIGEEGEVGVAVDPGTHTVYVTNQFDGTVSVIDGSTNKVTATVPVGKDPQGVAVDPDTHTIYVASKFPDAPEAPKPGFFRSLFVHPTSDPTVSVIDGSTNKVTATVPVGKDPKGVAVDAVTRTVYVANFDDGTVSVIDGSTNKVTATVPVGKYPRGVAVDPVTHTVFVTTGIGCTVSVIDGSTNKVTANVMVHSYPNEVAVDPGTHTVYVTQLDASTVSVIDGSTNKVTAGGRTEHAHLATVPVGKYPQGVAVDPGTHTVYVTNRSDGTVSVIEPR